MCFRLLITGGIGSGKSAVGAMVTRLGVPVLNADHVGHQVLQGEAFPEVASTWPSVVSDGVIDRRELGRLVFAEQSALRRLESITHPHIRNRLVHWLSGISGPAAIESPLLIADWFGEPAVTLVVDAPMDARRRRLRRRGLSDLEIDRRMSAQPSRTEWLASADEVLDNSTGVAQLRDGVLELFSRRGWFVTPEG